MVQNENAYCLVKVFNLLILLICSVLPFVYPTVFNKDFLMYAGSADSIVKTGLLWNIFNNTLVFYILFSICGTHLPFLVVQFLQISTLAIFFSSLQKIHPKLLLSLTLILFFTMLSNQIRTCLSLVFGYFAIVDFFKKQYFRMILLLILAFLSHILFFFVAVIDIIVFSEIAVQFVLLFAFAATLLVTVSNPRLEFYFSQKSYYSFLGIACIIFVYILKDFLSKKQLIFIFFSAVIIAVMGFYAQIASRCSEVLLFLLFYNVSNNLKNHTSEEQSQFNLVLLMAFLLFAYSFVVIIFFKENGILFRNFFY